MSKTDKTRPWRVQLRDAPAMRPKHNGWHCRYRGECDLPADSLSQDNFTSHCYWEPVREPVPWRKMFSDPARKHCRRQWYASERGARRATLRSLTRDANSDGEIDEDVIDNRVAGRYAMYGGGWWD